MRGEDDPVEAAAAYERELRTAFATPAGPPRTASGARFDLVLLGLGTDGHTASLFPGSRALHETLRLYVPARSSRRITGTYSLLNATDRVVFLVAGAGKAEAVRAALHDSPGAVPASLVQPRGGPATWLLDREAASLLG
jgi:6-phosphogluconolactonase